MNTTRNRHGGGFKRLAKDKYKRKREKGIYFRCDKKFLPAHRCKNKQLNVLLFFEEAEDELEAIEDELPQETKKNEENMALSLNADRYRAGTILLGGNMGIS